MVTKSSKLLNTRINYLIKRNMPDIMEIEQLCFPSHWWTMDEFEKIMKTNTTIGITVSYDNDIVGYAVFSCVEKHISIENLAIHPSCWRRGFGSRLISELKNTTIKQNRDILKTYVSENNIEAQLFFKAAGFVAVDIQHNIYSASEQDCIIFEWSTNE